MIKRTGYADLPLHSGTVPRWLADRMMQLGTEIVRALLMEYGKREVLVRLSDPLWFQSLGAVLGMDWHSSGITTSVMYALKRGINAHSREFGLYVAGGRGSYSRQSPQELVSYGETTGLDGLSLARASRLCAKVDSAAVQDGFQLYQHNFIVTDEGDWAVVQQGMNIQSKTARRYHWCSASLRSFVEEPHTAVTGENRGKILNLTDKAATQTRSSILALSTGERPDRTLKEIRAVARNVSVPEGQLELFPETLPSEQVVIETGRDLVMPRRHQLMADDVDLKRLGGVLATAYESQPKDFESLLLTPGLGPRTLQSLTLVSEVIFGTPSRFCDPARFSFAHGGKDGHPFPVPTKVYDESIRILGDAINRSRLGWKEKGECIRRLSQTALAIERNCDPKADFEATIQREQSHSRQWGGRTCRGFV